MPQDHPRQHGPELQIEVKCRKDSFKTIYNIQVDPYAVRLDTGECVLLSRDIIKLLNNDAHVFTPCYDAKVQRRLKSLKKWLGSSDILAVKDDRKHFVFIEYYG